MKEMNVHFAPPHEYRNKVKEVANKPKLLESLLEQIQSKNEEMLQQTQMLNEQIVKEKIRSTMLRSQMGNVVAETNGSSAIVDDYKSIYELTYVRNIMLLLGTAVLGGYIAKNWSGSAGQGK
jgi:hypothetical protein